MTSAVEKYVLIYYVPIDNSKDVNTAIHATGAGTWPGKTYGETCFVTEGSGQFRPLQGANPKIGKVGELEHVREHRVEMVIFGKDTTLKAVEVLRNTHPYEVVAYSVVKAEDF